MTIKRYNFCVVNFWHWNKKNNKKINNSNNKRVYIKEGDVNFPSRSKKKGDTTNKREKRNQHYVICEASRKFSFSDLFYKTFCVFWGEGTFYFMGKRVVFGNFKEIFWEKNEFFLKNVETKRDGESFIKNSTFIVSSRSNEIKTAVA